eukprot:712708-Prymnesium_polylepis.1
MRPPSLLAVRHTAKAGMSIPEQSWRMQSSSASGDPGARPREGVARLFTETFQRGPRGGTDSVGR